MRTKRLECVDLLPGPWEVVSLVRAVWWAVKRAKALAAAPDEQPRHYKVTAGPIGWSVHVGQATGTVTRARDGSE